MYHTIMGQAVEALPMLPPLASSPEPPSTSGLTLPLSISGAAHSVGRSTAPGALPNGSWTAIPAMAGVLLRFGTQGVTQAGNRGHIPAAADRLSCPVPSGGVKVGGAHRVLPPCPHLSSRCRPLDLCPSAVRVKQREGLCHRPAITRGQGLDSLAHGLRGADASAMGGSRAGGNYVPCRQHPSLTTTVGIACPRECADRISLKSVVRDEGKSVTKPVGGEVDKPQEFGGAGGPRHRGPISGSKPDASTLFSSRSEA